MLKDQRYTSFLWDNGATGVNGSTLCDRNDNSVFGERAPNVLVEGLE